MAGSHIVVVLVRKKEEVGEMVRKWRRECVDVDSKVDECTVSPHTSPLLPGIWLVW